MTETTQPEITMATLDESHWPAVLEHRFVALAPNGMVLGWIGVSPVSDRCVYAGVVENSVYVHPNAAGQGVGKLLVNAVIDSTEAAGIWTIQAGIFPENAPSIALHRSTGFREVGIRQRLGKMSYGPMAGRWRDVLLFERRSTAKSVS